MYGIWLPRRIIIISANLDDSTCHSRQQTIHDKHLYLIGNSSAGIREAPHYGIPTINIGTRQNNRALNAEIINTDYTKQNIMEAINKTSITGKYLPKNLFGIGDSDQKFLNIISTTDFWEISKQKVFNDI